ncbi:DUF4177 domain-containing protein [Paracoccus sediminicola]|uniref:DUF4177 domain-containing protein n=1 Tax=Paracoccus sediminicola TaxID=3017783 RepID=UPI0022F109E5|nr:DUF4177 domain-containing protein [Paracoccus sediminicola]WBU57554.1 DUF4177 domain-containing protein [Paracoccus sediminicola]
MQDYEYSAVPAPMRSEKAKGTKDPAERYALTLSDAINKMAADGWEYLRAETLPSEERSGLTGRTTLFHNLLIFRRPTSAAARGVSPAPTDVQRHAPPVSTSPRPAPVTPPAGDPETTLPTAKTVPAKDEKTAAGSPIFSEKMRPAEPVKADEKG